MEQAQRRQIVHSLTEMLASGTFRIGEKGSPSQKLGWSMVRKDTISQPVASTHVCTG